MVRGCSSATKGSRFGNSAGNSLDITNIKLNQQESHHENLKKKIIKKKKNLKNTFLGGEMEFGRGKKEKEGK